jgi:hypothetical protein
MHTKVVTLATVVCLIGMIASADAAKKTRGTPGSPERTEWCRDKLQACLDNSPLFCTKNPQLDWNACVFTYNASCESSWGDLSTCKDDERRSQLGRGEIAPVLPGVNAPVEPKPLFLYPKGTIAPVRPGTVAPPAPKPLSPYQQQMPSMTAPVAPNVYRRGVEGEPATSAPTGPEDTTPAPK